MPDYSKGQIYTLRSYQTDEIYIGSSINKLPKRLGKHKTDHKNWKNGKNHYMTSYEIIKYDDCYIELLEEYPCENKNQLEKREGHHIRSMDCVNKNIAGRTIKEYLIDNADKIKEQTKQYRIENTDKINEKRKEKFNCDCGGKYTKINLARHQKTKKHIDFINKNI